jgi:hypothetical protein
LGNVGEHIGNLIKILWKHIGNMLGTWGTCWEPIWKLIEHIKNNKNPINTLIPFPPSPLPKEKNGSIGCMQQIFIDVEFLIPTMLITYFGLG